MWGHRARWGLRRETGTAGMSQEMGPREPGGTDRSGFVNRWKSVGGGRSSFVYIVIGVVALTLVILLAIIYFSASERERLSPPICTDITQADAEAAVLRGEVERLTIVYDDEPHTPTSDRYGPVLAKLDYVDGTCSNLPQGIVNQDIVYTIAGVIAFYNENTDGQQVEIIYQTSGQLGDALFATPTAFPTEPPTPPPTSTPEPTSTPTEAPTETGGIVAPPVLPSTSTPVADGTPAASPAPRPAATVIATP